MVAFALGSLVTNLAAFVAADDPVPPPSFDAWPFSAEFWIIVTGSVCAMLVAMHWHYTIARNDDRARALARRDSLRSITVIVIVIAATNLAFMGKVQGKDLITLFAAITGYVLGSADRKTTERSDQTPPAPDEKPTDNL